MVTEQLMKEEGRRRFERHHMRAIESTQETFLPAQRVLMKRVIFPLAQGIDTYITSCLSGKAKRKPHAAVCPAKAGMFSRKQ